MVKVKRETLKDGTVVYRARGVSCGRWPNGKRRLRTITGKTKKRCFITASFPALTAPGRARPKLHTEPWPGETVARSEGLEPPAF